MGRAGYFSRIERGWASAPLYTYLAIADVLELQPGVLLGPDEAQRRTSGAEEVLLGLLRRKGISAEDAIARLFALDEPGG